MQKTNMKLKKTALIVFIISFFSCTNNSEDDLIIKSELSNITYNGKVKSIIDSNCISCHGDLNPSAGLTLTNYNLVKQAVTNKGLIDRISRSAGDPQLMPQSGKLPQQTIDLIIKWNADGLIE